MRAFRLFHIRREEYPLAIATAVVLLFFHTLIISKFFPLFAEYDWQTWDRFLQNYHMSGFDPITYDVVTDWKIGYSAIRHPLLPLLVYPLYLVNQVLWYITGANCVQLVVGVPLFFFGFFSIIFLYRIMREIVGIGQWDATLLSLFFLFFAHILVAMIVPDHFCVSLFLILLTLYVAGKKMQTGSMFTPRQMMLLFLMTTGVTLSNGFIVLMAVAATNRRRFFTRRFLLPAFIGTVVLTGIGLALNDTSVAESGAEMKEWLNGETLRWNVMVENMWGESIQLHRKHILGDVLIHRPVIVRYTWWQQYVCEIVIVCLVAGGLAVARKRLFAWLMAGCFAYAFMLHIILGFAINEVHIMACHWVYVVPVLMSYLFLHAPFRPRIALRLLTMVLTFYLMAYHGILLYNYLTWPLR